MNRLVEDPDAVAALAGQVGERTGKPQSHIEKDFWVTEVLRGVAAAGEAAGVEVIFKGGTSLSKVYGLIERFSEDVDVLVVLPGDVGTGAKDTILKALVGGAEDATGLKSDAVPEATGKGERRGARFKYRPDADSGTGLSEGVFLEMGSRGGGLGANFVEVRSMLAIEAPAAMAEFVEAEPVTVRVMAPCRTMVEKLTLLHTAHSEGDEKAALKGARHYYDIYQLLQSADVMDDLAATGVAVLARDVCTYSHVADMPATPRPTEGFATSPAFTQCALTDQVRDSYEAVVLEQLLWPRAQRPSFDDCINAVHAASGHL